MFWLFRPKGKTKAHYGCFFDVRQRVRGRKILHIKATPHPQCPEKVGEARGL